MVRACLFAGWLLAGLVGAGCAGLGVAGESGGPEAAAGAAVRVRPRPDALIRDYVAAAVAAPPDSIVARFRLDTTFYRKYVDANGVPILSSARVPDEALLVARHRQLHAGGAAGRARAPHREGWPGGGDGGERGDDGHPGAAAPEEAGL